MGYSVRCVFNHFYRINFHACFLYYFVIGCQKANDNFSHLKFKQKKTPLQGFILRRLLDLDSRLFSILVNIDQDAILQRDRQAFKHWFAFVIYHHHRILREVISDATPFLCYHVSREGGRNFKGLGDTFNLIYSRRQIIFHVDGYLFSLYKHSLAFTKGNPFDFLCTILTVRFPTDKSRFHDRATTASARKRENGSNTVRHKSPQETQPVQPLASPSDNYYSQDEQGCNLKTEFILNYFISFMS